MRSIVFGSRDNVHGSMGWWKCADAKVHQLRLTVGGVGREKGISKYMVLAGSLFLCDRRYHKGEHSGLIELSTALLPP